MPLEILHRAAPCRNVPVTFTLGRMNMDLLEHVDDPLPTASEAAHIRALTANQIAEIDSVLLSHVEHGWRKVALIVAKAMRQFGGTYPELPDVYYAMRIADLVQSGSLELQGNFRRMRFSEVRLPQGT